MTSIYLRLGIALLLLAGGFAAGWRVEAGRWALHEQDALRAQEQALRAEIVSRDQEIKHREQINAEAERAYLATVTDQNAALDAARSDLRNVRLRLGTCSRVPATPAEAPTSGTAAPESKPVVPDNLAEMVGDRFARCDAIAAQLNALIDWNLKQ